MGKGCQRAAGGRPPPPRSVCSRPKKRLGVWNLNMPQYILCWNLAITHKHPTQRFLPKHFYLSVLVIRFDAGGKGAKISLTPSQNSLAHYLEFKITLFVWFTHLHNPPPYMTAFLGLCISCASP